MTVSAAGGSAAIHAALCLVVSGVLLRRITGVAFWCAVAVAGVAGAGVAGAGVAVAGVAVVGVVRGGVARAA
jgi:hypothetical protein